MYSHVYGLHSHVYGLHSHVYDLQSYSMLAHRHIDVIYQYQFNKINENNVNKMKNKKYHTVGTVPKSNIKIPHCGNSSKI